jgi:acetoin utilization deacetylase AcuC-like enzyme
MRATGYYTHALCAKHDMGQGHPECPERLGAIWDRLLASGVADALRVYEAPAAAERDLARAHDRLLLSSVQALCQQVADGSETGGPARLAIDADTAVNSYTWQAALRAAGAVVAATDAVLDASSTTSRWRRCTRLRRAGSNGWRSLTLTCTTATARRTSWPGTTAF